MPDAPIHANDLRLLKTVTDAMEYVAKEYGLPLKSVRPSDDAEYATANLGTCSKSGDIQITFRGKTGGVWEEKALPEQEVWDTAAHELAHLRHFDHGVEFHEFEMELQTAMQNRRVNYQSKVMERLVKMQDMREGFARMGSETEAEAFAGMINKMLLENELNPSDLDYARGKDNDPVVELECDLSKYRPKENWRKEYQAENKKTRIAWQEALASVIANGHLCKILVQLNSNRITFVGTKSHATAAEYCYGVLVHSATRMSVDANYAYNKFTVNKTPGFRESWLRAFVSRIDERLKEIRKAALRDHSTDASVQQTGLMRLNQALVKTDQYLANKFSKTAKYANPLNGGKKFHAEGHKAGIAAADAMKLGQRGLNPSVIRGKIGDGQ